MDFKDYYAILGIDPTSSPDEISRAYRHLARQYHPDVNPHDVGAGERFKEVNEAYQVLSDAEKRAEYDLQRAINYASGTPEGAPGGAWQEEREERPHGQFASRRAAGQVDIEWADEELGAKLHHVAEEVARDLREALLEFGEELDALSRTLREGQPNRPPPRGVPRRPPRGRPPYNGRPPREGKPSGT